MSLIEKLIQATTDPAYRAPSKAIDAIGVGSTVTSIVNATTSISLPDVTAAVSLAVACMWFVKLWVDIKATRKKDERDEAEHKARMARMYGSSENG